MHRHAQRYAVSAPDSVFKTWCPSLHTRRFTDTSNSVMLSAVGCAIGINYRVFAVCASRRLLINLTVKITVTHFPAPLSCFTGSCVWVCVSVSVCVRAPNTINYRFSINAEIKIIFHSLT